MSLSKSDLEEIRVVIREELTALAKAEDDIPRIAIGGGYCTPLPSRSALKQMTE